MSGYNSQFKAVWLVYGVSHDAYNKYLLFI